MKEMKIGDVKVEKEKKAKEPAPHVKAAQIEKEAVRELSKKGIEKAVEASTFGGKVETPETNALDIEQYKKRVTNLMQMAYDLRKDKEILKAEILDMKKTISKMQQAHEAEVQDLKDQLGEAQALANAATKYKDEVIREKSQYSEALDDDSVAFEEILVLAEIMQLQSKGMVKLAKQIAEKTDGRI